MEHVVENTWLKNTRWNTRGGKHVFCLLFSQRVGKHVIHDGIVQILQKQNDFETNLGQCSICLSFSFSAQQNSDVASKRKVGNQVRRIHATHVCPSPLGGTWWISGIFGALHPESSRFKSHCSRHVRTLGKSFTHNCL